MALTQTQLTRVGRPRTQPDRHAARRDVVANNAYASGSLIADRYRVTAMLGQGGMGTVYAAIELRSGKQLALKRTLDSASATALELFKREFHTLRGLRHPNIIEVYDYGSDGQGLFYTMELLEGGDLGCAAPLSWASSASTCGRSRQRSACCMRGVCCTGTSALEISGSSRTAGSS